MSQEPRKKLLEACAAIDDLPRSKTGDVLTGCSCCDKKSGNQKKTMTGVCQHHENVIATAPLSCLAFLFCDIQTAADDLADFKHSKFLFRLLLSFADNFWQLRD